MYIVRKVLKKQTHTIINSVWYTMERRGGVERGRRVLAALDFGN